jgi:nucleoside-diphosphate-sugar epimerase
MRVLITGASGFIGSQLARLLVRESNEVYALLRTGGDRWRIQELLNELQIVEGDLLQPEGGWLEVLKEIRPESCFHFAWYAEPGVFLSSPLNLRYLQASLRLAEGLAEAGCKKLTVAGSFSEYDQELGYLSESSAIKPNTQYGAAKAGLYQALSLWAPAAGIELLWPRIFSVYGPMEHEKRFVPAVILAALRGEPTRLSPGEQLRDYLHVADAVAAVWVAFKAGMSGPVNIGSGKPVAIGALAKQIGEILGRLELIRLGDLPYRAGDPMFVCANTERLRITTEWEAQFSLEDGLRDTIRWWQDHMLLMS